VHSSLVSETEKISNKGQNPMVGRINKVRKKNPLTQFAVGQNRSLNVALSAGSGVLTIEVEIAKKKP
jgi:hypothetical protein